MNTSSSALANPHIQFYQGFKRGDLADGQILSIVDDLGGAVTYTARRRANWPDMPTQRSGVDLACKTSFTLPGKIAITSLTISGTTATCTTSSAHGLTSGDKVVVQPQNPDTTVGNPSAYYCGLVVVLVTGASTFTYTVPGITPSGTAAVGMEMCYTRTLVIRRATGTWNDAIPAGKTVTDVLTDFQTNFDNVTFEHTDLADNVGATVGSGIYQANFFTSIAQAGTDKLRTLATGPTACDFLGIMKFADTVGGARHLTLAGWFYLTAHLNPATGAVQEIQGRVYLDQSLTNRVQNYYTFRSRMKLGTTVVRSRGLSSNAAIDGKLQTFAPSAVNTGTNVITASGHGFQGGERVRFTTTGTLPSGLALNTDYPLIWVDGNSFKIGAAFSESNQGGTSSGIALGTQGTGTHTVTCWQQSPYATRQAYTGVDGNRDRWTGAAGALSPVAYHVIHDTNYLQQAGHIHRIDLTINFKNPVSERSNAAYNNGYLKAYHVFGSPGIVMYAQNNTGGGWLHEYGAPFTDMGCRSARYPADLGARQTLRVSALGTACFDSVYTHDDTNWRPPVTNHGPARNGTAYPGMSAPDRAALWSTSVLTNFTSPTSFTHNPGLPFWSNDHRYSLPHQLYLFEGGQDIHDLMVMDPMQMMMSRIPSNYTGPGDGISGRWRTFGGVTYYSLIPFGSSRSDVWAFNTIAYALLLCDATAPEHAVLKDYMDDTLMAIDRLINVEGATFDPNWLNFGGWNLGNTMVVGPGQAYVSNDEWISTFFEGIMAISVANAYQIYPSVKFQAVIGHFSKFLDNLYRNFHNTAYSAVYLWRCKGGPALDSPNSGISPASLDEALAFENNVFFLIYLSDGRIFGAYGAATLPPFTPPINGEKQMITTSEEQGGIHSFFTGVPPEVTRSTTYYVRAQTGDWYGYKFATTNSDGTIIPSYSVQSTSTVSTNMGTGTTVITTAAVLTGMYSVGSNLGSTQGIVVITSGAGTEICEVPAGRGTANLTLIRGKYGTTALAHGAGATIYVPYLSGFFRDLQMRDVPFPPAGHGYRVPNAGANYPSFGYRTLSVAALGAMWKDGIIPRTAYDNAYAWFNDPIQDGTQEGPSSFGNLNTLMHSFNPNL